eukprot:2468552-Prymnesium_polylepis.1
MMRSTRTAALSQARRSTWRSTRIWSDRVNEDRRGGAGSSEQGRLSMYVCVNGLRFTRTRHTNMARVRDARTTRA